MALKTKSATKKGVIGRREQIRKAETQDMYARFEGHFSNRKLFVAKSC